MFPLIRCHLDINFIIQTKLKNSEWFLNPRYVFFKCWHQVALLHYSNLYDHLPCLCMGVLSFWPRLGLTWWGRLPLLERGACNRSSVINLFLIPECNLGEIDSSVIAFLISWRRMCASSREVKLWTSYLTTQSKRNKKAVSNPRPLKCQASTLTVRPRPPFTVWKAMPFLPIPT